MRQENIGGMEKVRCGKRKHRGWQDSNGEAETGERESESEEEGWNMVCCQPAGSERVLGWRGLRAGGDTARILWVPGRWQCREKKTQGCGWRGMGQVGGCRWTEEGGIEGGAAGWASATGFCYPTGCPRSPYLQELRLQPWAQSQMSAPGAATSLASPAAPLAASHRIRAETSPCAPPGG